MNKPEILQHIISQLSHDMEVLFSAAKTAHEAATHEENQPDNKYDTLALEASYVAQGQANRAQEIRRSIEAYKQLSLTTDGETVRLASLVAIEGDDGTRKTLFIGPAAGGLRIAHHQVEITVITPSSPLGRELIGKGLGDSVEIKTGPNRTEYVIAEIS